MPNVEDTKCFLNGCSGTLRAPTLCDHWDGKLYCTKCNMFVQNTLDEKEYDIIKSKINKPTRKRKIAKK